MALKTEILWFQSEMGRSDGSDRFGGSGQVPWAMPSRPIRLHEVQMNTSMQYGSGAGSPVEPIHTTYTNSHRDGSDPGVAHPCHGTSPSHVPIGAAGCGPVIGPLVAMGVRPSWYGGIPEGMTQGRDWVE